MASAGHEPVKAVPPALPLSSRPSMRTNNSATKGMESARKQPAGSGDNPNRKAATPPLKAWQGPNPITSRAKNASNLPNGIDRLSQKPPMASSSSSIMDAPLDRHAHDRLLFLLGNMTGLDATLTLKNGEKFAGVLSGGSFEGSAKSSYTLKMVRRIKLPGQSNANGNVETSEELVGEGDDHVVSFDVQDTLDLNVSNVHLGTSFNHGTAVSSFRTDTEISRSTDQSRERKLQKWEPSAADMSLDDMALEDSGANGWDQFKANEQRYGVSSTYDMDMYTSTIDKSHPQYAKRLADAERIAREIEKSAPVNSHVAEERQQNISHEDEGDEEDKYSGVKREFSTLAKGSSGSYVPPSRRPITNMPTVPGAPYDPAIISSQLAKPAATQTASATDDKPTILDASGEPVTSNTPPSVPKASPNTTEGHVRDTADAFKHFANSEKLRIRQAQEQKRTNARNEKNVRINDLKKFAENFKLKSRVPDDLVPILAKNHDKQQEIRRKAEEAAQVEEKRAKDKPTSVSPSTTQRSTSRDQAAVTATGGIDTTPQQPARSKQLQNRNQFIPQPLPGMSPRQAQLFKGAAGRGLVPTQQAPPIMHIPTGPAAQQEVLSPSAGSRLSMSAKAFEFRPAASTFMPSGASPSPQRSTTESTAPAAPVPFFDDKEKLNLGMASEESFEEDSNVIAYLQSAGIAGLTDDQKKSLTFFGGVPQPYRTPPTWNVPQERINTMYEDAFGKALTHEHMPMLHMTGNQLPHAHQLPPHMHGNISAQQARYFQQPHPHTQGYDPRMQYPSGPGSSLQSSPRFPNAQVTLGQMPQFMGMPQFAGQPMPYAGLSPNLAFRQPHAPSNGGQMMMLPGQPHGPMTPMRGYQHGQHFTPNMPGQIMVQPGQQSPYGNGQVSQQPYSPLPHNAHPHMQHMGQHQGQPGFNASPRPGPHMMHHTGSHQGFQPHQMGMAYAQLPGQGSPYAVNQRQMSAGHYQQMTPRQQQAMPANPAQPSPSPAMSAANAGKNDEGK